MEDISQKIFSQAMELWITPEIEKRKEVSRLPSDFKLRGAQIIFSQDRNFNRVRLNEEVKAIVEAKANRDIEAGEKIYESDFDEIKNIGLTDDDPNVAHITLLKLRNQWIISFDARYNKGRVKGYLEASKEFYDSSKDNLENKRLRPFYENMFACFELLTEALLIQFLHKNSLINHNSRLDYITNWAGLGNIDEKFSNTLKRLWKLRGSARYMDSTIFKNEDHKNYLKLSKELYDIVEKSIS